ncbi:MAG: hypothetical protein KY428_12210, partial [Bacteroidetes bacterium]|nr:hypothetical protein [Bacteroidota bacterium]
MWDKKNVMKRRKEVTKMLQDLQSCGYIIQSCIYQLTALFTGILTPGAGKAETAGILLKPYGALRVSFIRQFPLGMAVKAF